MTDTDKTTILFLGRQLEIIEALARCSAHIAGVYVPARAYAANRFLHPSLFHPFSRLFPRILREASAYRPVIRAAESLNLPLFTGGHPGRHAFTEKVRCLNPDIVMAANFEHILPASLLSVPRHGCVNFHPSLLPKYRGPNPIPHILANRERYTGATWHLMTTRADAGPILAQSAFRVLPTDTAIDLLRKSVSCAVTLLPALISAISSGTTHPIPQTNCRSSTYPKSLSCKSIEST